MSTLLGPASRLASSAGSLLAFEVSPECHLRCNVSQRAPQRTSFGTAQCALSDRASCWPSPGPHRTLLLQAFSTRRAAARDCGEVEGRISDFKPSNPEGRRSGVLQGCAIVNARRRPQIMGAHDQHRGFVSVGIVGSSGQGSGHCPCLIRFGGPDFT
jgi:hypothetical protein